MQSLRKARTLLETANIEEVLKYVEAHQNPRLWFVVIGLFVHILYLQF